MPRQLFCLWGVWNVLKSAIFLQNWSIWMISGDRFSVWWSFGDNKYGTQWYIGLYSGVSLGSPVYFVATRVGWGGVSETVNEDMECRGTRTSILDKIYVTLLRKIQEAEADSAIKSSLFWTLFWTIYRWNLTFRSSRKRSHVTVLRNLLYRIHMPLLILKEVVTAYGMVFWTKNGAYAHGGISENRKSDFSDRLAVRIWHGFSVTRAFWKKVP